MTRQSCIWPRLVQLNCALKPKRLKVFFSRLVTPSLTVVWSLSWRRPLVYFWQPLVYDVKCLSGDFYNEKKIEQRVCWKLCVSNRITPTESLKMLQKCFGESTLSRTQVFEWHKAFSEGLEVVENLLHASRLSTSVNDDNSEKVIAVVWFTINSS